MRYLLFLLFLPFSTYAQKASVDCLSDLVPIMTDSAKVSDFLLTKGFHPSIVRVPDKIFFYCDEPSEKNLVGNSIILEKRKDSVYCLVMVTDEEEVYHSWMFALVDLHFKFRVTGGIGDDPIHVFEKNGMTVMSYQRHAPEGTIFRLMIKPNIAPKQFYYEYFQ